VTLSCLLLQSNPAHAQRDHSDIPDPDPEVERRSFRVADGFEVNLFAADPLLAKPIQMNFDAAGRLWVACSDVYPQILPGQKANDKVLVIEGRGGRAVRTTVFADGLLIPTGVEPGDGGAYVADSTDLLHLADTDGDGKADRRRVVLSGFGTEDTHHILHTLRWGPDGALYFNQSTYIHSHIETPYGVRRLNGGGVWRLRPESLRLEVFARGFINPWGHHFDRWGQSFVTDGAGGEGINYVVPGAMYAWAVDAPRILQGLNPGSPKYCGEEILSGRHLPPEWRGNIVTNDFRGHRVCRFVLREDSSGYAAREMGELIKTAHAAFRPVDVKMGPDGALYIADWYNPIIQHGEVDFRDPRRDHAHGRIWRVTARGRPLVAPPRLVGAPTEALLDALKAPEDWTRLHAKRTLKERGRDVLPALAAWVRRLNPADPDHEHHLLEALWTYQSLDVTEPDLLARLLNARDHHARAAAVRVMGGWHDRLADPLELLAARVTDSHPQVRLEAVRALGRLADARAAELAMRALDLPTDLFLDYALWLTARDLEARWLPGVLEHRLDFNANVRHLLFALLAVDAAKVVRPLGELFREGKVPADQEEKVLSQVAGHGGPPELAMIFDLVVADKAPDPARQAHLLSALETAARQRGVRPGGDLTRLRDLLGATDEAVHGVAARLVGLWKLAALRPRLAADAGAANTAGPVRRASCEGLALLGDGESRRDLERLSGAGHALAVRRLAVAALATVDVERAAKRACDLLASVPDGDDPADVLTAFLGRKAGARTLAGALAGRRLPADVAKLGLRAIGPADPGAGELIEAIRRAGGLANPTRTLSAAEMQRLVADVARQGDPSRGEAVFRRGDQACLKCHAVAGAGGQVGPDLLSIGASAPVDYLVESILLPNKAVKENYHCLIVATKDGRLFTGIRVRETGSELVLRTAEDREVTVPVDAIEERRTGGSLMPEGVADSLTRAELVDLVRFLSELGKVGPYSAGKGRVVRRWQVAEAVPPGVLSRLRGAGLAAAAADPALTWAPAYSNVSGSLPLAGLPLLRSGDDADGVTLLRFQLDLSTGGPFKLLVNSPTGLTCWVDGRLIPERAPAVLDLPAGLHTLTVAVNRVRRGDDLRFELDDVPGSPAQVRAVGGK
jgi:putative heme-binding domain-containing protein